MSTVIHLLGDGILDNHLYLENKAQDLKKELSDIGFTVNNYAVDKTKVGDVIGGVPPYTYAWERNIVIQTDL